MIPLTIFYREPDDLPLLREQLQAVDRLPELVRLRPLPDGPLSGGALYVDEQRLHLPPDWLEERPAVVFPSEIPWEKDTLLGCVFGLLGNMPACVEWLDAYPRLAGCFALLHALSHFEPMEDLMEELLGGTDFEHPFQEYAFNHNVALGLQHGRFEGQVRPEAIEAHYADALLLAFEPSFKALTLRYYLSFLLDQGREEDARRALDTYAPSSLSPYPRHLLQQMACRLQLRLYAPGMPAWDALKERLWESLQFYQQQGCELPQAQLLQLATAVASREGSYAEAQGYVLKAIGLLQQQQQPELLAEARLLQARLLFDWGQQGHPQFLWQALHLFQQVLQVFNEQDAPFVFADIQHQLGMLYAALPDEPHKRALWASLSAAAFGNALRLYTPEDFPKEHALVCQNYGRSLLLYPAAAQGDHALQALGCLQRALSLLPEHDPARPLVLLNALEAGWMAGMPDRQDPAAPQPLSAAPSWAPAGSPEAYRYALLQDYAQELATYPDWKADADRHLLLLSQLSDTYARDIPGTADSAHAGAGVSR